MIKFKTRLEKTAGRVVADLPIEKLGQGEICPPLDPDHRSWKLISPWDDPLASRGGFKQPSRKSRVTHEHGAAIEWQSGYEKWGYHTARGQQPGRNDRSFITGKPEWREYSLRCVFQPMQNHGTKTADEPYHSKARAGLVFRMQTVRRYYAFCLENQNRLVLYRRNDDEWVELDARDVGMQKGILTLELELEADGIRGWCPQLEVELFATDSNYRCGLTGFRALGICRLFELKIMMTPGQHNLNQSLERRQAERTVRLSGRLPDEKEVGEIDLSGGKTLLHCKDFCLEGRNDMLFSTPDGTVATTWDGKLLWSLEERLSNKIRFCPVADGRRIIYAMTGKREIGDFYNISVTGTRIENIVPDEMLAIDGLTGMILNRKKLPASPREELIRTYDFSYQTGCTSGKAATDIIVREWRSDWYGGGENLWAYDGNLKLLWQQTVHPGYGHSNAVHFCDLDEDGRTEVVAGGTLVSPDGEIIWRHDLAEEVLETYNGQHYDAVLAGRFSGDAELDPVVFLISGSAGVYVVDAMTGRTRSHHRIGHAQGASLCRLRNDQPGLQILVHTRWDNYGIMTLFSGRGDRLWSIQPDYLPVNCPVQWVQDGPQHIWACQSIRTLGLYDGYGRMVKPLSKIRSFYHEFSKQPTQVLRRRPEEGDLLGLRSGDRLVLFGPDS